MTDVRDATGAWRRGMLERLGNVGEIPGAEDARVKP